MNQCEMMVVWDKDIGKFVYNVIVWQFRQMFGICEEFCEKGYNDKFREKIGFLIDLYFFGMKVKWILDNVEGVREKVEKGELLFGMIDIWFIWKMLGGKVYVIDYFNVFRMLMFNIYDLKWDEELFDILGVLKFMLFEVKLFFYVYVEIVDYYFFGKNILIVGVVGDQQFVLFGQVCFEEGMGKNIYGIGCFMLMNIGEKVIKFEYGFLIIIVWGIDGKVDYVLEGSIFVVGFVI